VDELRETSVGSCNLRRAGVFHYVLLQPEKQRPEEGRGDKSFLAKCDMSFIV